MSDSTERVVSFRGPAEPGDRVLIVDDDGQLAADTASALVSLGLSVSSITSASEALDVAYRYRPTIVIADIDLGVELGGVRLADAIRRRWGASMILLSPRTDLATIRAIAAAAPDVVLYKPFYWRQLELTVRLTIASRAARPAPTSVEAVQAGSDVSRAKLEDALSRIAIEISRIGYAGSPTAVALAPNHELLHGLPAREREIVTLLLQHHRVPAIARLLSIRPSTVRNHLKKVFKRVGVRSQQDLLMLLQSESTRTAT
jgi:DNA-binding NarL/FixJ family response regulator